VASKIRQAVSRAVLYFGPPGDPEP
jgi:hypothetical protein